MHSLVARLPDTFLVSAQHDVNWILTCFLIAFRLEILAGILSRHLTVCCIRGTRTQLI